MPQMKFNVDVRYPTHNEFYAVAGQVKEVPKELVERFLKRGAVIIEEGSHKSDVQPKEEKKVEADAETPKVEDTKEVVKPANKKENKPNKTNK